MLLFNVGKHYYLEIISDYFDRENPLTSAGWKFGPG